MTRTSAASVLLLFGLLFARPGDAAKGLEVSRIQLNNGLRLVLSEQKAVPIVAIDCLVDGGARVDPQGQAGLANLTGALLEEGTKDRTSQEISKEIDSLGGVFGTGSASDWIMASAAVLARDFDTGMDLVAQSLRHPTFPEKAIERLRAETLSGLKAAREQPGYVASRGFSEAVFGKAPYGPPLTGTEISVKAITQQDIRKFYEQWVLPERTICAIVGDIQPARMKEVAEEKFGSWAPGNSPAEPPPATAPPEQTLVLDMATTQANVVVGQLGVARKNPDFFAIRIMNHILGGGGFTSRLVDSVRDKNGLAYSIYSRFGSNRLPGSFQVVLQTKVESAAAAIELVRNEIARMHRDGVTPDELDAAQDYLTGNFPLSLDSTSKLAGFLGQIEYFGLGDDYIESYGEKMRAVSADDVHDAARRYLDPQELVLVVVGPQGQLASQGLQSSDRVSQENE